MARQTPYLLIFNAEKLGEKCDVQQSLIFASKSFEVGREEVDRAWAPGTVHMVSSYHLLRLQSHCKRQALETFALSAGPTINFHHFLQRLSPQIRRPDHSLFSPKPSC
jgi:hypothetical protein